MLKMRGSSTWRSLKNMRIKSVQQKPLWLRYEDDTLISWDKGENDLKKFPDHRNDKTKDQVYDRNIERLSPTFHTGNHLK